MTNQKHRAPFEAPSNPTYLPYAAGIACTVPDCGIEASAVIALDTLQSVACSHAIFARFDGELRVAFVDSE